MNRFGQHSTSDGSHDRVVVARQILWIGWQTIRLPISGLLIILEPIVRNTLSVLALLGVLTALILKVSGAAPHLPFWQMLATSVGCVLLLALYYGLIRLFSK